MRALVPRLDGDQATCEVERLGSLAGPLSQIDKTVQRRNRRLVDLGSRGE